ncbi:MAG: hypothetical protein M3P48_09790 [Actinomycetota bacterium]|nr:hypothetical protein [Actinomycetota bacterium]
MEGATHYHGLLDTVGFGATVDATVRAERAAAATGALMLDILLTGATPVLSQTQAFDNALLLDQVAQTTQESRALLRLFGSGYIRVRIFDSPSLLVPETEERFSLVNAFRSALAEPGFLFSAWPQLAEPDLRAHVFERLCSNRSSLSGIDDDSLVARLEGLRELDSQLRASNLVERALPSIGPSLSTRVAAGLAALAHDDMFGLEQALAWLNDRTRDGEANTLDRRGTWYNLISRLSKQRPELSEATQAVTDVVDAAYNAIVAESLGVTGWLTSTETADVAAAIASVTDDSSTGGLAVELLQDPRRSEWLTWSRVEQLLPDLQHMSPQRRLDHLAIEHSEYVGREAVGRQAKLMLRLAIPMQAAAGSATVAGSVIGAAMGGVPGAGLGGLLTAAVTFLAVPVARRAEERAQAALERKQAKEWLAEARQRATVATGTASSALNEGGWRC